MNPGAERRLRVWQLARSVARLSDPWQWSQESTGTAGWRKSMPGDLSCMPRVASDTLGARRSALRARSGLLGEEEVGDPGPSSSSTRLQSGGRRDRIDSGERRGEGVEIGAVAKALKVETMELFQQSMR
jgi:hypothetical protein